LVVQQEGLDNENPFSELDPSVLFSEVRKYLASKKLPFKVFLILDNAAAHSEPHEFKTEGVKVVYLPPNTTSLI